MKQEIKPATGRLGVLVVGVGGAVATTMIVGTLASRNLRGAKAPFLPRTAFPLASSSGQESFSFALS